MALVGVVGRRCRCCCGLAARRRRPHGIGFQKGCNSPTKIGDPVVCHYTITNNNFTNASLDTVTINSLADVTHAAAGDTPNTNILGNLELFMTSGNPTCIATGGTGTFADPWTGVTECTLPGGNVISGPRLGLWSEIRRRITTAT